MPKRPWRVSARCPDKNEVNDLTATVARVVEHRLQIRIGGILSPPARGRPALQHVRGLRRCTIVYKNGNWQRPLSWFVHRVIPFSRTCSEANPLGLRFLRRFRLARTVEATLGERALEGGLVNFFSFVDVDRAACVFPSRLELKETAGSFRTRLGEGELHDIL